MKWFGESWDAPVCEPDEHVDAPVDRPCAYGCGCAIEKKDQGFLLPYVGRTTQPADLAYHRDCFLKSVLGPGRPQEN